MSGHLTVSKLEVAQRQLSIAIRMLFANDDPIAAHTLVGAASEILSRLVEKRHPEESWDKLVQGANNLPPKEYFFIMRKAQNWFKHADIDPDGIFEFDPAETEALTFWAVMNASLLAPLSTEAMIYQIWFIALQESHEDLEAKSRVASELFGDIRTKSRAERLLLGAKVLQEHLLLKKNVGSQ
ncbi:hypothetical protein DFS28_105262 [Pseudomonas sp. 478]|uniref:hypothetical protein n=1 Tax=unclassified Pseudomonas TaxID=196821 RepID=UPI000DAF1974|nr:MULTISPECIES: hypothetical protein [unclassified Pseudomonas]PZW97286.1 hypothetical protein DFS28_105262 [Pseudomonas sp. 478]TCV54787.1 hypothetical protein EDB99_103263 [Pseudomonas sp. 460]